MDYNFLNFGLGALTGFVLAMVAVLGVAIYVYFALALQTIAKKLKHKKPWLAWIPIANGALVLQLGGFHWAWIFLVLIPIFGWVALWILTIISLWRIFEKRKYPGALALIPIAQLIPFVSWVAFIAYAVVMGLVAWKNR